jgi:NTP pyrophosphatase (non-canonical NTP hydrolase)|tara:strand:- start:5341 stop:5520 length:180 start_codon:yes stop_codon:yes gene_type:complete
MENSIKKLGNQNFNNICKELEDNLFQTVRNQLIKNNLEVIEEEIGEMVNDVLRAVYYQE